jgi:hypothetical protein
MFRFSIRDVLWLTVVVALAVGWWLNSRPAKVTTELEWAAKHQELVNVLRTYGWQVTWEEQEVDCDGRQGLDVLKLQPPTARSERPG